MKKNMARILIAAIFLMFPFRAFALTYLAEDAARGGMWANVLVDASDEYKNDDGSFISNGGWSDAHNLLGAIPENQDWYAPVHSSIVTMNNDADSWVILSFAGENGQILRVNNDPTNPEGYDGIIWGNGFYVSGGETVWSEPGTVYLSQDGVTWWKLPQYYDDPYNSHAYGDHQTFDHTPGDGGGLVSPGAPLEYIDGEWSETGLAGGDAFDMSTAYYVGDWTYPEDDDETLVGLEWFSYILITGEAEVGEGVPLYTGPDPDSIYVFSTSAVPVPGTALLLASGLLGLISIRRRTKQP